MRMKSLEFSAALNELISKPKTISALVFSPSNIILFRSVAALSTAINCKSISYLSSKTFPIIGPGPHSETKES